MKGSRFIRLASATAFLLILLAGLALAQEPAGTPLGTAFTYQGQLKSDDAPYTGTCDIKFGLFDVSTGGTAIATLTKTNVAVDEGYLTVSLDYGSGRFAGDRRWLEMSVRCPAGGGGYTTLAPRQELTASPYALYTANADLLDGSHASSFAGVVHDHWGETWYGSGTALTLDGGAIGIAARGASIGLYGTSELGDGTGVFGLVTAGSGTAYGVKGQSHSPSGSGVYGEAKATSGLTRGVEGVSDSDAGTGVVGRANSVGGYTNGVWGQSESTNGKGVAGVATAGSGTTYGVYGQSSSTSGRGVFGEALATGGSTYGVLGKSASSQGYGVYGYTTATSGSNVGIYGQSNSTSGYGAQGYCSAPTGVTYGVHGTSISTSGTGVFGRASAGSGSTYGVYGQSDSTGGYGVFGYTPASSGTTNGVYGSSDSTGGRGVYGEAKATSGTTRGVEGVTWSSAGTGVVGSAAAGSGYNWGVWGESSSTLGTGVAGVAIASSGETYGVMGRSQSSDGRGVYGYASANSGTTVGVLGRAQTGVSWGAVGWNAFNGAGVGAWSNAGDLIQAYDGDFPGGSLRFKVDQAGNVHYDGSMMPFVELPAPSGGQPEHVSLYGLASTEAWFEDLGSGRLVEGRVEVAIDPVFAQTVALTETYNVYLTAICQEPVLLFVSEKAADHFVVQGVNLDGQPSGCGFDYRLAARRLGYQGLRLEAVEVPVPAPAQGEGEP